MREQDRKIQELREALKVDPAGEGCIELARLLMEEKDTRAEAREVLFAGIAREPKLNLARLLLARSYYLDDLLEFSVRELVELQKHADVPSLHKLLDAFGAFAMPYRLSKKPAAVVAEDASTAPGGETSAAAAPAPEEEEDILAEIDLDDEFLDALDELKS
jgi:hypothetical protein